MNCKEVREILYEYIYDELDDEKKILVKRHLNECVECKEQYDELKALLIEDTEELAKLKYEIQMPEDLPIKINNSIYKSKISIVHKYVMAAVLVLIFLTGVPVVAYFRGNTDNLGKYKELNPEIVQEFNNNNGQMVEKSTKMKNIDFTIDAAIYYKDNISILYTVKIPRSGDINYAAPIGDSLGTIYVEDQLGRKYFMKSAASILRNANEDGMVENCFQIEHLKPFSTALKIRITSMEVGNLTINSNDKTEKYEIKKKKDVYGCWEVEFKVKR